MSGFTPSVYQAEIFKWVESDTGNAFIDAAAGAGKSTTLVQAAGLLPRKKKALFCAFNRHIAKELKTKLQAVGSSMESRTIHSVGRGALVVGLKRGKFVKDLAEPDGRKYMRLADDYIMSTVKPEYDQARAKWQERLGKDLYEALVLAEENGEDEETVEEKQRFPVFEPIQLAGYLRKLVDFRRLTLTEPTEEALFNLADHYDLAIEFESEKAEELFWPMIARGVEVVVRAGAEEYQHLGLIDYTDMVFLPIYLDLDPAKYDWIMVDEAQDLNACQLELVLRAGKPGARWLFCGDPHQSMYAFTGADTHSVENIIQRTSAKVLPLSICYRCPSSHISLAQQVYRNIEVSPAAGPGIVSVITGSQANRLAQAGDKILCRTTAPMVARCFALIREGTKSVVLGKDLGKNFIDLLKKLSRRRGYSWRDLVAIAEEYQREQERMLSEHEGNDLAIEQVRDKVATLKALKLAYSSGLSEQSKSQAEGSLQGFIAFIEEFFKPEEDDDGKRIEYGSFVVLSTIHRAKGLEADRVFIERSDLLPHPAAKKDWQVEQERNILYVALTRAKRELYFIDSSPELIQLPQAEGGSGPLTIAVIHGGDETIVSIEGAEELIRELVPARLDGETVEPLNSETVIIEEVDAQPVPLAEGRIARIAAIEILCPRCNGLCVDPATGAQQITPDLVGHTIICSRCKQGCIVPLNAFSLEGNVIAREKPAQNVSNNKAEKKGRTKKERKSKAGAKPKGKEARQPMQLSLDMRVIRTLKTWGVNASELFETLLKMYEPFLEQYAAVNDDEDQPEDEEEDEGE